MDVANSGPIDLKGRVAVVAGAASAIGQAACVALAREGAAVVICDSEATSETASLVAGQGGRRLELRCETFSREDVDRVAREAVRAFGRIDILVNSATTLERSNATNIEDVTEDEWNRVYGVNAWGMFNMCRAVWPTMAKQKYGKIVCHGSVAGKAGALKSGVAYSSSKGAVHAMVKTMARKGAPLGIYVNGIAPGFIRLPETKDMGMSPDAVPIGRLGEPEDLAEAIVFLTSQASNFVTGVVLDVNGGVYIS
jgi:3-oxoacyl-[acyl-carrier protein] reductase